MLNLTGNNLAQVPSIQLTKLTNLREIRLGQTLITEVPTRAFPRLDNLVVADFSKSSRLESINSQAFDDNPILEYVDFNGCKGMISPHYLRYFISLRQQHLH